MKKNITKTEECGLRLKQCRREKGYTQEKLAELSDYSLQTVSYIENGKRNMTRESAHAFSQILEVREEYLLCEDNSKTIEEKFAFESYETFKAEQIEKALHSIGCWEYIKYGNSIEHLGNLEIVNIEKIILSISDNEFVTCSEAKYYELLNDIREYMIFRLKQFSKRCTPATRAEIIEFKKYYLWDVLGDEEI